MEFTLVDKCTTLCAKRNSGKSQLLRWMVQVERDAFDKVFCICPTESINHFYKDFVDRDCIFDGWDDEWAEQLIATLTKVNGGGKPRSEHKKVLLILNDIIADANLHSSPTIKKLYARGRHLSISLVVTTQHLTAVSPLMRTNSDFIAIGQLNRASINILVDEFMSGDIDKADFIKMYNKATGDFGFLLINATSVKSNDDLNSLYGRIRTPASFVK
jgi:hypothetical protein